MCKWAASLSILLVIALFCFLSVGIANAGSYTYTLSGGPSPDTHLIVDDDLEVKVNGKTVFIDNDNVSTYDGRAKWKGAPITFSAAPGDVIQIIATNPGGLDIELSPLYLHVNGQSLKLSDGVPNTRSEKYEFFNERFIISLPPEIVITNPEEGEEITWSSEGYPAKGTCSGLEDRFNIYLIVRPLTTDQWWVQSTPTISNEGTWEAMVYFGTKDLGGGEDYVLYAILTEEMLNEGERGELPIYAAKSEVRVSRVEPLPPTVTPTSTPPAVSPISPKYLYIIPIALFMILVPFIFYIRRKRKKSATTPSPEQKEIGRPKVKQEALINLDYHLKRVNEDERNVFLELREKILRLGDVEERIKESEVSYNIKNRIIFADFFGFHRDHIWMYLKLNKDVEDLRRETEYGEKGFGIGFKRRLKLTKDTDSDYTVELVKQAIKKTTARDIEKKEAPLTLERAIYDPCKRDFIEGRLPRMKEWINRYDPGAYWFAVSVQNNTDKAIEEWGVELETSSALKVEEVKIEGMEYKIELRETYPEPYKNKYAIGVPKEYGIVIPKEGAQRIYFKLRADKPKTTYEVSGIFKSIIGEVPIRAKEFKYLCDTGVSPEAVKIELKKTFSEKDAARLALSFKTVQQIDRMCDQEAKTEEYLDKLLLLKNYTEGFSAEFTRHVEDFSRFMKQEQLEYLDDAYKGKVKRFCTNLVDVWINEFLKG